ncbi:M48 family metallopeptidase [Pseudoflavitalea rhizosphaerae]|uniref:M48 family metallopeptidase n=1 Tax=Pseudoflavitalea rhizosphaerae TaxID=1884793 RepID=UPI000F8CE60E|nr:M48 family metallopeptidase [Pseudoflavitalea rhizosphaerae]
MTTYSATYNHQPVTVILSPVTLTIRYTDDNNQQQDIHWLGDHIKQLEETTKGYTLHYTSPAGENFSLEFSGQELLQAIKKNFRHQKFTGNAPARALNSVISKMVLIAGIICGLILIGYIWIAPWLGGKVANSFSKETEISLGQEMYDATVAAYEVDPVKTRLLNQFYKQLHYQTGYPIEITVVKSPEVNAFAVPGGHIVVFDAILDNMKTPEELAALLGHEASHIALRHSLNNMFKSLSRQMFLTLIFGTDAGITSILVQNADRLKRLEYSRELETEADNNGMKLMHESKVDTEGMVRLMDLLNDATKGGAQAVNFLSTHPVFDKRVTNVKAQLKNYPSTPTADSTLQTTFHALYENF